MTTPMSPMIYKAQSGVVCWVDGGVGGDDEGGGDWIDSTDTGGSSVVKALTALQAL